METKKMEPKNWFTKQEKAFEENFFGAMSMMMIAQSCLGSIAAMFALKSNNISFLIIGTVITLSTNSAFIAQIPVRWSLGLFYTSVLTNLILIIIYFL